MAQAGFTPIQLYFSTTAAAVPLAANLAQGELAINITDGKLYYENNSGVVTLLASAAGASGDVVGPASSTDNALARFDSTTGKLIQNSVGILSDAGILTGLTGITSSGSITFSSLTSGRVPYATTAGLLTDSANLLYSGTDLTVYGLTVGRGGNALAGNTAVGVRALAANTSGTLNTATGNDTLLVNTTGRYNSAFGNAALTANTTGSNNTALGMYALVANTTGLDNTAIGYQAGFANTTSSNNVAIGSDAMYTYNNSAGGNVAIGQGAMRNVNHTAGSNIAIGVGAMLGSAATGAGNIAIGQASLFSITTGANNIIIGGYDGGTTPAGRFISSGSANVGVGSGTLANTLTANNNTAIGHLAGFSNATGAGFTAVGTNALYTNTASDNTAVGNGALYVNTTGTLNVAVGSGVNGAALGTLAANTTGSYNTALGAQALRFNTTANNNTALGYQAGFSITTAGDSTFLGAQAGQSTTGSINTAVGAQALYRNTTGLGNTAVGTYAGQATLTTDGSTYIGYAAGYAATGTRNTFIGPRSAIGGGSGSAMTTGSSNVIIGGFDGNSAGFDIRTANNYIVLSDGDGNSRGHFNPAGLFQVAGIRIAGGSPGAFTASNWFIQQEDSSTTRSYSCGPNSSTNGVWEHYTATSTGTPLLAQRWDAAGNIVVRNIGVGATIPTTSGTGITFPATQGASTNANTLDDYEEGTWSPTFSTTGTAFSSLVLAVQQAYYIKVGKVVNIWGYLAVSSVSGGTGSVTITNLPFGNGPMQGGIQTNWADGAWAGLPPVAGHVLASNSIIYLIHFSATQSVQTPVSSLVAGSQIIFNGSYYADN